MLVPKDPDQGKFGSGDWFQTVRMPYPKEKVIAPPRFAFPGVSPQSHPNKECSMQPENQRVHYPCILSLPNLSAIRGFESNISVRTST